MLVTNVTKEMIMMPLNMGAFDRAIRGFVVAPAAVVLALIVGAGTVAGVILFAFAGIMLGTAATGFCPAYTLVGISTHPRGLHRVGRGIRHGHA